MMAPIFTHSNSFHPDELLAIALLQRTVFKDETPEIVRTRDPELLKKAQEDPAVFVVDVGFEFDPEKRNFDHHQGSLKETWPDGTPYSACGLVWRWLRNNGFLGHMSESLLDALEEAFVKRADRFDNGIGGEWPEGNFLANYNRTSSTDKTLSEQAFARALTVAGEYFDNTARLLEKEIKAEKTVEKALEKSYHKTHGVLVLPDNRFNQYAKKAAILSQGEVNLVIIPRSQGAWMLVTTPKDPEDAFSQKTPAPEEWRGRSDFTVEVDGIEKKIVFCHKNGFLSVVEGTQEDALDCAKFICEMAHPTIKKENPSKPKMTSV